MPAQKDIAIYSGDTYTHELRLTDDSEAAINITGREYSGVIKLSRASSDVVASFSIDLSNPSIGHVVFYLASNTTANLTQGTYYYDFQEENAGIVTTLLTGKAVVTGQVG